MHRIKKGILTMTLVALTSFSVTVNAGVMKTNDRVNIRSKKSTSSDIITTLPKGTEVSVYEIKGDWASVSYNGDDGYIHKEYLSKIKRKKISIPMTGKINSESVNFRKKPEGEVIKTLKEGTKVTILSEKNGWTKVKTKTGKKGYVYSDYISNKRYIRKKAIAAWRKMAVQYCKDHIGDIYSQDKRDEEGYADCSSLVRDAYKYASGEYIGGYTVSQTDNMEDYQYTFDSIFDVKVGDLVYHMSEDDARHTGIYIGDGQVICASQTVGKVKISYYDETSKYWEFACKAAPYCYDQKYK